MNFSRIIGTGSYLPAKVVTNEELARTVDTSDEWIRSRTGIAQRHFADPSQSSSDLALEASRRAIDAAGIAASEIDLIVLATSTPDQVFPSTACLLQAKLGIKGAPAFDLQAVCCGFVYALSVADSFIRSGRHRCALVVGAEVFTRLLDWNDRTTSVLFGDGAGAVVLRADRKPGVLGSVLHADGSYAPILCVPGTVAGGQVSGTPLLRMDGPAVFKFAVRVLDEVARETLQQCGLEASAVDWLVPHQANARIIEATARRLGIDSSRIVLTVDRHANTSAASVPLALDTAVRDGRIRAGHKIMLEGVGGGFTWGAALVEM